MSDKPTTMTVDAIGKINFEGNIVPHSWYQSIKFPNGKPDTVAIILLSDIIYWYRPTVVRDEQTAKVIERRRKFDADKLQRSYKQFAAAFGFTKRQVMEACYRLRDQKLITIEIRQGVRSKKGQVVNNVVYLEPVVANIIRITSEQHRHTL